MWTLGVVFIPVVYRVARLETRRTVQTDYYRISRMMGTGALRRVALHIVPAVLPQVVVQSASLAAIAIGTEAALSFLGLGTQPPAASWGLMLNDARRYLTIAPYLSIIPGIAAGLLTFALQYLSDVLARRIDVGAPVRSA
jgi:peptide/nickel transport system permease protein